jgi:SAM-dependent methyltransferase
VTEDKVKKAWLNEWENSESIDDSASFIGKYLRKKRLQIVKDLLEAIQDIESTNNLIVIDLGCGGGTTLKMIRESGLHNSIGIDFVKPAIEKCVLHGFKVDKDVYLMDAKELPYPDQYFDIVFSEGLWEHFEDPEPYIAEACRIAKKWLLVIQPDHYTIFGWLLHKAWQILGGGGVREYSFPIEYFIELLDTYDFMLSNRQSTIFNEQAILLFTRRFK